MKALRCDRCGKYFDEPTDNNPRLIQLSGRSMFKNFFDENIITDWSDIDLCDDCYNSLVAWTDDPNITPTNLNGYIAVGAIDNMLSQMEGNKGPFDDEKIQAWEDGWHEAIKAIRNRLEQVTDLTESGILGGLK